LNTTQKIKINSNSGTISKIRLVLCSKGLREVIIVLSVYAAYSLTQGNLVAKESLAFHNANSIINLERYLKIYWELTIQSWFISYNYLIRLANASYTYLFYPVMVGFAIWAYNRH
jgi:hypothetical protein